jgi:hypothetical protein
MTHESPFGKCTIARCAIHVSAGAVMHHPGSWLEPHVDLRRVLNEFTAA